MNGSPQDQPLFSECSDSLRQRIAEILRALQRREWRPKALPALIARLGEHEAKAAQRTPPSDALDQAAQALHECWALHRDLTPLEARHARNLPWLFFHPGDSPHLWASKDPHLAKAMLATVAEDGRPRRVLATFREFLRVWPADLPAFDSLLARLDAIVAALPSPAYDPWRERCARYRLLKSDGPTQVARLWVRSEQDYDSFVEAVLGPERHLANGNFWGEVAKAVSAELRTALRSGRIPLCRVFAWFADPQGSLRFSSWKRLLATAALEPFLNLNPSDETKRALAAFLCRTIGHPILHSSAWYDIDSQLRDVLLRWLVQTSFEDFFRLVDRTAGNPEHWVARRNFWYSYLKNNLIDDAWLILGPAASARLDPRGRANLNAGSLRRGAGTDSTHSALLLKIRGITIAEFSHNRKCRIWLRGNRAAPKLYEREYDYASLTDGCNEEIPHYGSQNYRWQARISSIIEEHTGIADPGRRGK